MAGHKSASRTPSAAPPLLSSLSLSGTSQTKLVAEQWPNGTVKDDDGEGDNVLEYFKVSRRFHVAWLKILVPQQQQQQ